MNTIDYIKLLIEREPKPEHFQKIVSALRGPDLLVLNEFGCVPSGGIERLKYLTTGRIRAIVAPEYNGTVTREPLTEAERFERENFLPYAPKHFKSHYKEAVEAIRVVFQYDLKYEREIKNVTNSGPVVGSEADGSLGSGGRENLRKAWSALGDLESS